MMSIRVVNAVDGYAYLLRNVATADVGSGTKTKLGDYYQATGTPRYLVSVPDNGDSRWSRYGLPAL